MATVAIAVISLVSCNKDNNPILQFEKTLYVVYEKGEVTIGITVSDAPNTDLVIPLRFNDGPVKGVDYLVSSESVTIKAGETVGYFTLTNVSMTEDKQLAISFEHPAGYSYGLRLLAIVAPDTQEGLVYNFFTTKTYADESVVATINVKGSVSGSDVVTSEDIYIPLTLSGDGASALNFVPENTKNTPAPEFYALLRAGETSATARFTVDSEFSGDLNAVLSVNTLEESRFIPGDNSTLSINVRGLQTPDKLVGTWKFSKIYDADEVNLWFEEEEDDPELLPTHNEGFTLTFAKNADGTVTLTPGGKGDFLNFFRTATVSLTSPVNTVAKAVTLGKYSTLEGNMFVAADDNGSTYQNDTYYKLSSANRAFSASEEKLGEATVVFALSDEGLRMEFRDYDTPPFGEMWWDGFDPDMFGFASLFVKQ